jgi:hypothetical protein
MTTNFLSGMAKSLKPLFVNNVTREFVQSFKAPDDYLELKLNEICSRCPLCKSTSDNSGSRSIQSRVDKCRMEYFGQLLQSFVGRPGDDETIKLYTYLRKCEDCLDSKMKNTSELKDSSSVMKI